MIMKSTRRATREDLIQRIEELEKINQKLLEEINQLENALIRNGGYKI